MSNPTADLFIAKLKELRDQYESEHPFDGSYIADEGDAVVIDGWIPKAHIAEAIRAAVEGSRQ